MSAAYKNSDKICTGDRISNQRISGSVATRLQQQRQIMCFISANIATAAPLKYAEKKAAGLLPPSIKLVPGYWIWWRPVASLLLFHISACLCSVFAYFLYILCRLLQNMPKIANKKLYLRTEALYFTAEVSTRDFITITLS